MRWLERLMVWSAVACFASALGFATTQIFVDVDNDDATGYGAQGADVMIECCEGQCQVYGTYEPDWVPRLDISVWVCDDGELVELWKYRGELVLCGACNPCDDLKNLADCMNGLKGP